MRWLAAGVLLVVAATLRSAVETEAAALLAKIPEWIIRVASRGLPRRVRSRYREEWLADLDAEPDRPLWRLATALRILCGVGRLRWAVRGGRTAAVPDPEAPGESSDQETKARLRRWREIKEEYEEGLLSLAELNGLSPEEAEVAVGVVMQRCADAGIPKGVDRGASLLYAILDWAPLLSPAERDWPPTAS